MSDAVDDAVDIVARGILAHLIDTFEWEDYPEVGDGEHIIDHMPESGRSPEQTP